MNLYNILLTILIPLAVITFPIWLATLAWVYRDARQCGKSAVLAPLLIGLLFWPIGLLVWLILRQDWLPKASPLASPPSMQGRCPRCGQTLASGAVEGLCPACLIRQAVRDSVASGPGPAGFTPPSPQELADLFPQLEIMELLGKGGMGAVYKARQRSLDRVVALKILPTAAGADPAFAERFQREARALAQLSHPNIVGVHDFGQAGHLSYFVMEYVDGVNLRQLERAGRLNPREALAIVPQICEALQFAHDRGVVHRDIKPENILVDARGRVKIADFGLAKLMRPKAGEADLTLTRDAMGTPQYMAPEQIEKPASVDHRADIYSLGVVFYEMLTGELPIGRFSAPSQRVQMDVRLDEVVLKALEKEPDRRYQQASAFKTNVETVAGCATPLSAAAPAISPVAVPPATPLAEAGDAADDPRAGWLRRHFRRHERRSPGAFLWRVSLEGILVCLAVALVAALLGVKGRNETSGLAAFIVSSVFIAPWLETLLFQMLPVGVARLCGGERRGQMIASIVLFALPHFFIAAATGLVGLAGGFYLAFSYTHWRRHSRARAYWMTVAQHALHNTAAVIVVIVQSASA
jgi:predicted Ser/Thr protein kinase